MKRISFVYFLLFNCYLFGNEFLNPEVLNYSNIIYIFFITIILLIISPFFINKELIFNKIIKYKDFNRTISHYKINNTSNKKELNEFKKKIINEFTFNSKSNSAIGKLKEELSFKNKFLDYEYYLLSKIENKIKCQKVNENDFKSELLFDTFRENEFLFFFKIKKSIKTKNKKYSINVNEDLLFYFRILNLFSINPLFKKVITLGLFSISIFITVFFIIYSNYFIKIIMLLGVIPINININFYEFLIYIFSDIFIFSFGVIISILGALVPILYLLYIFIVYILLSIVNLININFTIPYGSLYKHIVFALIINILIYGIFIFLFLILLLEPLKSIYKIKYPNNNKIDLYNTNFYYGDYQYFTSKFSKIRVENKYVYSVGNDNIFFYYYDLEENKNNFLFESLNNKNELKDCKQILLNVNLSNIEYTKEKEQLDSKNLTIIEKNDLIAKLDSKMSGAKIKSILLNNKIININLIKKTLIKDIENYKEKQINFYKDIYVNEIINKCEILVELKNEKGINYLGYEKFNNLELLNWINSLRSEEKDKIRKVYNRIEEQMFDDIDDEYKNL